MRRQAFYLKKSNRGYLRWVSVLIVFCLGISSGIALERHLIPSLNTAKQAENAAGTVLGDNDVSSTDTPAPVVPNDTQEGTDTAEGEPVLERVVYTVAPGDTLSRIASLHDTTSDAIMLLNDLTDPNMIREGQRLVVQDVLPDLLYGRIENNDLEIVRTSSSASEETVTMTAKVFTTEPVVRISPTASRVLFTENPIASTSGARTWVSRIDGSERQEVVSADQSLPAELGQVWRPDENQIAYSYESNLWLHDLQTNEQTLVTRELTAAFGQGQRYAFAPDSSAIAFLAGSADRRTIEIYNIAAASTQVVRADSTMHFTEIHWPRTDQLYVVGQDNREEINLRSEVYAIAPQTGASLTAVTDNLLPERQLVFDETGSQFAFVVGTLGMASRQAEEGVWMYNISRRMATQVFSEEMDSLQPLRVEAQRNRLLIDASRGGRRILYQVRLSDRQVSNLYQGRGLVFF